MKYFNPAGELMSNLSKFNLFEARVTNLGFEVSELVRICLSLRLLTMSDLEAATHKRLCDIGMENIDTHIDSFSWTFIRYPDHLMSPISIGYPIMHGKVSKEKLELIKFDHGETLDDYINKSHGLLDRVLKEILNREQAQNKPDLKFNWVPCSDGGPCTC